jgi:hypothetical protein
LLAAALGACQGADAPPELRPDSLLRVSLGLTDRDVVHFVQVRGRGASEVSEPERLAIQPGEWVSFQGGDARGHVVRFDTLAIVGAARVWLRETDQVESPPLLTPVARWVVSFRDAPVGTYPFVVEGGGVTGTGRIELMNGGG